MNSNLNTELQTSKQLYVVWITRWTLREYLSPTQRHIFTVNTVGVRCFVTGIFFFVLVGSEYVNWVDDVVQSGPPGWFDVFIYSLNCFMKPSSVWTVSSSIQTKGVHRRTPSFSPFRAPTTEIKCLVVKQQLSGKLSFCARWAKYAPNSNLIHCTIFEACRGTELFRRCLTKTVTMRNLILRNVQQHK